MAEYLPLGTPVVAADTLTRVTEYRVLALDGVRDGSQRTKRWERTHRHMTWRKPDPVRGIVVGVRHLANGWTSSEEYGEVFTRTDGVTAYLIATDLHRAPVYALLEDVTPAPAEPVREETDRAE